MTLDEILAASEDLKRQQREGIRQMNADMASESEKRRIAEEDWIAPPDVERAPEEAAPLDWFIRGQIEKANAKGRLSDEPSETLVDIVKPWFEIEETD